MSSLGVAEPFARTSQTVVGAPGLQLSGTAAVAVNGEIWLIDRTGGAIYAVSVAPAAVQKHEISVDRSVGAVVPHSEGVLLIGGRTKDGRPSADVTLVRLGDGAPVPTPLAPLPLPVDRPATSIIGTRLFVVAAGVSDANAHTPLYSLDLSAPTSAEWCIEPSLPATTSRDAIAVAQAGGLYVLDAATAWLYLPKPREATTFSGWRGVPDVPAGWRGKAAVPVGSSTVLINVPAANGTSTLLMFDITTESWSRVDGIDASANSDILTSAGGVYAVTAAAEGLRIDRYDPVRGERSLALWDYLIIVIYFVALAVIGVAFSAKQTDTAEFSLGGRQVPWWAAGLSMFATGASSISFLAIPALTYATNSIWVLPLAMMVVAFFIQGWVIFPLLRRIEITSTYEYLERRFNRPLRYIASAQAIVFQTVGRTSVVLVLPAMALSATSGIDVFWAVVIMGVVTTAYTAIGGFEAVIWTDVVQGILMFAAPMVVIGIVCFELPGGATEMITTLTENHKLQLAIASWDYTLPAAWILCLAALFQHTVSLAGDQPVIQRVFSTPMKTLRRSAATYITCGILIGLLVNGMGLAIFAYFHRYPEQIDIAAQGDQLVPVFLVRVLPAGIAGLIVAAIFAAAMSTVSSTTNSVATLLHQDFYLRFFPSGSERTQVRFLKVSSCVVGLIGTGLALFLASRDVKSMFVVWNMVAGLLGSGVVGVFCLGMFTTRANASGAIIGAVTSIGVNIYVSQFTDIHWSAYVPLSLVVCVVVGYVASLPFATPEQSQDGLTVFTPAKPAAVVPPLSLEAGAT